MKNIPIPSNREYTKRLIEQTESVIKRMRWKAFFYLNPDKTPKEKNTYELKSRNTPPQVEEMTKFEEDLLKVIEKIEFRNVKCQFLSKLRNDVKSIRQSDKIFVPADKTNNFYKLSKEEYHKLVKDNTTARYTRTNPDVVQEINKKAKLIAKQLKLDDRIEILAEKPAFITIKDHKENFPNHIKCRLINPTKSEIGIISKAKLDKINTSLIKATGVHQWKSTQDVIQWFQSIDDKQSCSFLQFDVVEFYPSITENLLEEALKFASEFTSIPDSDKEIINHAKKTLLFHDNSPWNKTQPPHQFDVTMGSYDGAETCELIGTYLLHKIKQRLGNQLEAGLYRDDGLAILRNKSACQANRIAKSIIAEFKKHGLKITVDHSLKVTNFLDITLNLGDESYRPYTKPNNTTQYVNRKSNHQVNIIKTIPTSVNQRLSTISSNEDQFRATTPPYQQALEDAGYNHTLTFDHAHTHSNPINNTRKRQRNIIWFNPPFSKHVTTNVARKFLNLIDKHFPKDHILHKIFNRNNVKVSYCCMNNMSRIVDAHNKSKINTKPTTTKPCNCRRPNECPLEGNCQVKSAIYKATVATSNHTKEYIGLCETTFKTRFNNHKSSFNHQHKKKETALSKHIWDLKDKGIDYNIKWSILKRCNPYSNATKRCQLCLWEKYFIITANKEKTLNSKSELISKCRHANKFLLCNN